MQFILKDCIFIQIVCFELNMKLTLKRVILTVAFFVRVFRSISSVIVSRKINFSCGFYFVAGISTLVIRSILRFLCGPLTRLIGRLAVVPSAKILESQPKYAIVKLVQPINLVNIVKLVHFHFHTFTFTL